MTNEYYTPCNCWFCLLKEADKEIERGDYVTLQRFVSQGFQYDEILTFSGTQFIKGYNPKENESEKNCC